MAITTHGGMTDAADKTGGVVPIVSSALLGTVWKHRKKGGIYTLVEINHQDNMVRLHGESKGTRSTWKYAPLLTFDYDQLPNVHSSGTATAAGPQME